MPDICLISTIASGSLPSFLHLRHAVATDHIGTDRGIFHRAQDRKGHQPLLLGFAEVEGEPGRISFMYMQCIMYIHIIYVYMYICGYMYTYLDKSWAFTNLNQTVFGTASSSKQFRIIRTPLVFWWIQLREAALQCNFFWVKLAQLQNMNPDEIQGREYHLRSGFLGASSCLSK